MIKLEFILGAACLFAQPLAFAQTAQPTGDATQIYLQAAKLITDNYAIDVQCPSASNMEQEPYPPYTYQWRDREADDFDANIDARALTHQARSMSTAHWPSLKLPGNGNSYLNNCRPVSNELADAALYQMTLKNYAASIELLRDLWHFTDLLDQQQDKKIICLLVSIGIRAQFLDRLNVVMANASLTKDPKDLTSVQVTLARKMIDQLLNHPDARMQMSQFVKAETKAAGYSMPQVTLDHLNATAATINIESGLAALSLACHVYHFETGKWPASLADLHDDCPNIPIDPGGDGKQTLGYVLIKAGLPNGNDRPLVYSRHFSKDGLFFRTDQPAYTIANTNDAHPTQPQKQGGQFRDVAAWIVPDGHALLPATQPLK